MIPNKIQEEESILLPSCTPHTLPPELLRGAESFFAFLTQVHFFKRSVKNTLLFWGNLLWQIAGFCLKSTEPFSR